MLCHEVPTGAVLRAPGPSDPSPRKTLPVFQGPAPVAPSSEPSSGPGGASAPAGSPASCPPGLAGGRGERRRGKQMRVTLRPRNLSNTQHPLSTRVYKLHPGPRTLGPSSTSDTGLCLALRVWHGTAGPHHLLLTNHLSLGIRFCLCSVNTIHRAPEPITPASVPCGRLKSTVAKSWVAVPAGDHRYSAPTVPSPDLSRWA